MRSDDIRIRFLRHFAGRGHTLLPGASLLPAVPAAPFTASGRELFARYLSGSAPAPWSLAASVQNCVRVNDGRQGPDHAAYFHVAGHYSFDEQSEEEAIRNVWELSTLSQSSGGYGLDPERLRVTVDRDDVEGLYTWRDAGLPYERITVSERSVSPGTPPGFSSTLSYDIGPLPGHREAFVGKYRPVTFWTLVFSRFHQGNGGPFLPDPAGLAISGAMGVERMAMLLQSAPDLQGIDEVRPLIDRAARLAGVRPGDADAAHEVLAGVADDVRTALMLMTDGTVPSNKGHGGSLRSFLRRAVRAMAELGTPGPVLVDLLSTARDCMLPGRPELAGEFPRVADQAAAEEDAYRAVLGRGRNVLETVLTRAGSGQRKVLPGRTAFLLHDAYGLPVELTRRIAGERGLDVDLAGFAALMARQQQRGRAATRERRADEQALARDLREVLARHGPTDCQESNQVSARARVLAVFHADGEAGRIRHGELAAVVLDRTPFFARAAGQAADTGHLSGPGVTAEVVDVWRPHLGLVVHRVRVTDGVLRPRDLVHAAVDPDWRLAAQQAHTAGHILLAAVREVCGPTAVQVRRRDEPGRLLLDFSRCGPLGKTARGEIEEIANLALARDLPVETTWTTLAEARALGLPAPRREDHAEHVPIVEIGGSWSRELCSGTHVERSAQVGLIALTAERSAGVGIRTLEAAVGTDAFRHLARERDLVTRLCEELGSHRPGLEERVAALARRATTEDQRVRPRQRPERHHATVTAEDAGRAGTYTARTAPDMRLAEA